MNSTTSSELKINMENQGRTYTWLMLQLNISRATFYKRLKENTWTYLDLVQMKSIGVL